MRNDRSSTDFSEDGADLYPHLKLTSELFPRILATRRIEDDDAEYFGAFLTKTAVRILIDFLNRTFRLRSCDIEIDGNFPVPCTQYYTKRCLAPCVSSICSREKYLESVNLARLFLSDQRGNLSAILNRRIQADSENLDFESAARYRDILLAVEGYWQNPRWQVWLGDTTDTYETDETAAGNFIYLVSQRGRHVLGRKVFQLPKGGGMAAHEAIGRIIASFYRFHLPKEIRVTFDFGDRKKLADDLSQKFGRPAKIVLVRPDRQLITSTRALRFTRSENELDFVAAKSTPRQIVGELKRLFGLRHLPKRIEAFDVAHISGTSFVAASSVWENGRFLAEEYEFHISDKTSELAAIGDAVFKRLNRINDSQPDLILLDGGKSQMKAVTKALGDIVRREIKLIGAVKPRGQHSSIAYFIAESGDETQYDPDNPAQNMLRLLRDAAHDLANRVHRDLRDLGHHYELAALLPSITEPERRKLVTSAGSLRKIRELDATALTKLVGGESASLILTDLKKHRSGTSEAVIPLIVPIRFDAENGDADDLRPILLK